MAQIIFLLDNTALEHGAGGRAMEETYELGEVLFLITQIPLEIPKKNFTQWSLPSHQINPTLLLKINAFNEPALTIKCFVFRYIRVGENVLNYCSVLKSIRHLSVILMK